jgi:hypothetical protein
MRLLANGMKGGWRMEWAEREGFIHRSRRHRRLLEGGAVSAADRQRGCDAGGGAGHGAGAVVGVACCAGVEDAGESEGGEGKEDEGGEMHRGGCRMVAV